MASEAIEVEGTSSTVDCPRPFNGPYELKEGERVYIMLTFVDDGEGQTAILTMCIVAHSAEEVHKYYERRAASVKKWSEEKGLPVFDPDYHVIETEVIRLDECRACKAC